MNNFSFEPLKLKLATNNIVIPLENGVADLTNAETSAKIMLAGKELFPDFDDRIGGRNLATKADLLANIGNSTSSGTDEFGDYIQFVTTGNNQQKLNIEYEADTQYTLRTKLLVVSGNYLYLRWVYTDGTYTQTVANPQTEPQLIVLTSTIGKSVDYFTYTWVNGGVRKFYEFKIEKGNKATDWTPAPEEVLQLSTLTFYNCSAAIVGDLIKITSHKPGTTRGWVDATVNYGNLSNTKRLNWSVEGVEPYNPLGTLLTMNNRGIKL